MGQTQTGRSDTGISGAARGIFGNSAVVAKKRWEVLKIQFKELGQFPVLAQDG
jgi:hypothetical protein